MKKKIIINLFKQLGFIKKDSNLLQGQKAMENKEEQKKSAYLHQN